MQWYLCFENELLENAKPYPSKKAAIAAFHQMADELSRYGQSIYASVHAADQPDELDEYPDFILSSDPDEGIKEETA